jgi:hypothetical protein
MEVEDGSWTSSAAVYDVIVTSCVLVSDYSLTTSLTPQIAVLLIRFPKHAAVQLTEEEKAPSRFEF